MADPGWIPGEASAYVAAIRADEARATTERIVAWFRAGAKHACEADDYEEAERLTRFANAIEQGRL